MTTKATKDTFTYASYRKVVQKAKTKAAKEGTTLSEKINEWLNEYIKPNKKAKSSPSWIEKLSQH